MNRLPQVVLDYQLEVEPGSNQHQVLHSFYDPDQPPSAPPRIETWERETSPIGAGGQGQVFLQRCTTGARGRVQRAVKVIPFSEEAGKQRYLKELQAMAKFSHKKYPQLFVQMIGWYSFSSKIHIAMEHIPHGDLYAFLDRRSPLAEDDTRAVITQVLQGLRIMHQEGFAHRDIKPQNILIKRYPSPNSTDVWWIKLADFGISKDIDRTFTIATELVGTIDYMAPELLHNSVESSQIDHKAADIWAVGATMAYIATKSRTYLQTRFLDRGGDKWMTVNRKLAAESKFSAAGQSFLQEALLSDPEERLDWRKTAAHEWISPRPSPAAGNNDHPSSATALATSTSSPFTAAQEMTSLATKTGGSFGWGSNVQLDHISEGSNTMLTTPREQNTTISTASSTLTSGPYDSPRASESVHSGESKTLELRPAPPPLPPRTSTPSLQSRLFEIASSGWMNQLEEVLTQLKNLETRDDSSRTALYRAAEYGRVAVVRRLLNRGANMTAPAKNGWTPIHAAASQGHHKVIQTLVKRGVDVNTKNGEGQTPMDLAITYAQVGAMNALYRLGADISQYCEADDADLWEAFIASWEDQVGSNLTEATSPLSAEQRKYENIRRTELRRTIIWIRNAMQGINPQSFVSEPYIPTHVLDKPDYLSSVKLAAGVPILWGRTANINIQHWFGNEHDPKLFRVRVKEQGSLDEGLFTTYNVEDKSSNYTKTVGKVYHHSRILNTVVQVRVPPSGQGGSTWVQTRIMQAYHDCFRFPNGRSRFDMQEGKNHVILNMDEDWEWRRRRGDESNWEYDLFRTSGRHSARAHLNQTQQLESYAYLKVSYSYKSGAFDLTFLKEEMDVADKVMAVLTASIIDNYGRDSTQVNRFLPSQDDG